jgi:hypothetical protein
MLKIIVTPQRRKTGELIMTVLYIIGLSLSTLAGLWHFSVPYLYQWHSYIPNEYKNLIVAIDYVNFFFSLILAGYSLLLLLMRKKVFSKNKAIFIKNFSLCMDLWFLYGFAE